MRRINAAGLALVRTFEGCRLLAYDDLDPDRELQPGDRLRGTLTIGHGHTGADVFIGQRITAEEAERLLAGDLEEAEQAVVKVATVPLSDNAFAALVSLAFNIGLGDFARSTLLRKVNDGDRLGAAAQFGRWNKAGGKALAGLTRRRAAEAALFLQPDERLSSAHPTETPDGVQPQGAIGQAVVLGGSVAAGSATILNEAVTAGAALPLWLTLVAAGIGLAVTAYLLWRRKR